MVRHEWYTKTGADFGVDGETTQKQDVILNGTWLPAVVYGSSGGVAYFHHCWSWNIDRANPPEILFRLAWAADAPGQTGNVHWEVRATGINNNQAAPAPPLIGRWIVVDTHGIAGAYIHYAEHTRPISWGAAFNYGAGVIFEIERVNDASNTLNADAYLIGFGIGYKNGG